MISTAIIGVSGFGNVHYMDLLDQVADGKMRPAAACIINQAEEAEKCKRLRALGCRIYTDYRTMFAELGETLDLVMIPTGIALHAPMTIAALEADVNVMVEKPVTATVDEHLRIEAAQERSGKLVAVGYQNMYDRLTLEVKNAILDGRIGKLQSIKCRGLWPRPHSYYQRNNWAGKLKLGDAWILDSPINNALAHFLMQMIFFAGTELRSRASLKSVQAELYRARPIESFDTASIRIATDENVPLHFYVTHSCKELLNPDMIIQGDNGCIRWGMGTATLELNDGTSEALPASPELRRRIWENVCDAIGGGDAFYCDLELSRGHTVAVNAAHESCAIATVPDECLDHDDEFTTIKDIETMIDKAFHQELLLSETGVGWARKGDIVDVTYYQSFKGCAQHDYRGGADTLASSS